MSLAGSSTLLTSLRSLFRKKEQAPSSSLPAPRETSARALPLSPEELHRIDLAVNRWVRGKGYRMPDVTIEESASRIGCSSAQLYRYCIQRLGKDFRTWRMQLRIEDAKVLLVQEPDTSASHIGRMVGINDRSNFLRQFASVTGMTPLEWRRQADV